MGDHASRVQEMDIKVCNGRVHISAKLLLDTQKRNNFSRMKLQHKALKKVDKKIESIMGP